MRKAKYLLMLMILFLIPFIFFSLPVLADSEHIDMSWYQSDNGLDNSFNRTSNLRYKQNFYDGYYDADFSFSGLNGYDITQFDFIDDDDSDDSIILEITDLDGHNEVLTIRDYVSADYTDIYHDFDFQSTYGACSFWIYTSDATELFAFYLRHGSDSVVNFYISGDTFRYYDGSSLLIPNSPTPLDNTWYHIIIYYEFTTGDYQGLAQYESEFVINGIESGALGCATSQPYIDNLRIKTDSSNEPYIIGFDALDLTQDSDYDLGNVDCIKIDSNSLEPDKYHFHQYAIDTYDGGSLNDYGWSYNAGTGSLAFITGTFKNPETNVIDSENKYIRFYDDTATNNIWISRNYPCYTDEITISMVVKIAYFPSITSFGCYAYDDDTDLVFSIIWSQTAGGWNHYISNGTITNEINNDIGENDIFWTNVTFNIDQGIGRVQEYQYDDSETEYRYNYAMVNLNDDGDGFYQLKFNQYSHDTDISRTNLDQIGIYRNGFSLNEDEYGYATVECQELNEIDGNIAYESSGCHVGTCNPLDWNYGYLLNWNTLTTIESEGANEGYLDLQDYDESIVFTVTPMETLELIAIDDYIYITSDAFISRSGTIEYGTTVDYDSFFFVDGTELAGYLVGGSGADNWMCITFELDNLETVNYTLILNDMKKTGWEYDIISTIGFDDGTEFIYTFGQSSEYEFIDNQFLHDFGGALPNGKYISYYKFNISANIETSGTFCLGGISDIRLHYNPLGFIDLEDLHDSGILAIIVPIIMLVMPTVVLTSAIEMKQKGSGKKIVIPLFLIFSIILLAAGIIPIWLGFIIMVGTGALFILKRRYRN